LYPTRAQFFLLFISSEKLKFIYKCMMGEEIDYEQKIEFKPAILLKAIYFFK